MKVKDLVAALSKLDQELTVYVYTEHSNEEEVQILPSVFEIDEVSRTRSVLSRNEKGLGQFTFSEKHPDATDIALITVVENVWPV